MACASGFKASKYFVKNSQREEVFNDPFTDAITKRVESNVCVTFETNNCLSMECSSMVGIVTFSPRDLGSNPSWFAV